LGQVFVGRENPNFLSVGVRQSGVGPGGYEVIRFIARYFGLIEVEGFQKAPKGE
jgi:hypothetical protein